MDPSAKHPHILIDGSNLFIEGMRLAGFLSLPETDRPSTVQQASLDLEFRLDLRELPIVLGAADSIATFVGSQSASNGRLSLAARACGMETIVLPRDSANREKGVDMALAMIAMERAWSGSPATDRFVLVSGDRDFVPLVELLRRYDFEVEVAFWSHAARDLRKSATRFVSLDAHLESLRWGHPHFASSRTPRPEACVPVSER